MSFKIKTVPNFEGEVKRIIKKHRGIKSDLLKLINDLEVNPELGAHLGQNIYKSDYPFLVRTRENPAVQGL